MKTHHSSKARTHHLSLRQLTKTVGNTPLRHLIEERSLRVSYRKGQEIFAEGQKINYIYFVLSGKVKIARRTAQGRYIISRLLGEGHSFGLRSYFTASSLATVRAEAFDELEAFLLPTDALETLMASNYEVARMVIASLSSELEIIEQRTNSLLTKHLRARMADSVLMLLELYGVQEDGQTIDVLVKLNDLADLGHMTVANASRTMGDFVRERILGRTSRYIKIIDRPNLERIAQDKY